MAKKVSIEYKVLVGKGSIMIGKDRIKKGDRVSSKEVETLPDKLKVHFADEAKPVKAISQDVEQDEAAQEGE